MPSDGGYKIFNEGMATGSYSKRFFKDNYQEVVKFGIANGIVDGSTTVETLVNRIRGISPAPKKRLIKEMEKRFKFSYPNSVYAPTIQEVEGYDVRPIDIKTLKQSQAVGFGVNVPYNVNYNFLGSQFIKIVFKAPVLKTPIVPSPGFEVRTWYTQYPGIRILKDVSIKSDTAEFDNYGYYDVLKYQNDSLPDNVFPAWNELIGQDLGKDSSVYNPSEAVHQVIRYKDGYQTARADHGKLVVHIPLLFAHNRNLNDKLNMAIFNKHTIKIDGHFAPSDEIVRAALFATNSVETAPVELELLPLEIESCTLLNLVSAVNDVMFSLNLGLYYNKLYDYTKHEIYPIKSKRDGIKLRGAGELLQMAIFARPKSYSSDFDKWTEFTPLTYECAYVPIAIDDPLNPGFKKVAINTSKLYKQIQPFKNINLKYEGIHLMADGSTDGDGDSALWSTVDPFVKLLKYPGYFIRKKGLIYFNFNPHVNTKRIGCIFNQSKFRDPILSYEISDSVGFNIALDLNETFEVFVFRDIINNHLMSGDNITRQMIN